MYIKLDIEGGKNKKGNVKQLLCSVNVDTPQQLVPGERTGDVV